MLIARRNTRLKLVWHLDESGNSKEEGTLPLGAQELLVAGEGISKPQTGAEQGAN